MQYTFDIDVAREFGVDEAILINNFLFWTKHNKANEKHQHDGRTWHYNSQKALGELFPFWSRRQIQRITKSVIDKGIIVTGNYNKSSYDRTLWYAFKDEEKWLNGTGGWKIPNDSIEGTDQGDRKPQTVQPVPDSKQQIVNTDSKQNIFFAGEEESSTHAGKEGDQENKIDSSLHAGKKEKTDTTELPEELNLDAWDQFKVHREAIKKKLTPQAESISIKKLITLSKKDQLLCVERSIENGWTGLFPESIKPKGKESSATITPIKSSQPRIVSTPMGDVDLNDPYALLPTVGGVLVVCERDRQNAKTPIIKDPSAPIAHPPTESLEEHIENARQRSLHYQAQKEGTA